MEELLIDKIRYTKTGKRVEIYEYTAKLHKKILLEKKQFNEHIQKKHPEVTLEIIKEVLKNPDLVTKQSNSKKEHFYQKIIENKNYFVVVSNDRNIKNLRFILTAFSVNDLNFLKDKNKYLKYKKS